MLTGNEYDPYNPVFAAKALINSRCFICPEPRLEGSDYCYGHFNIWDRFDPQQYKSFDPRDYWGLHL